MSFWKSCFKFVSFLPDIEMKWNPKPEKFKLDHTVSFLLALTITGTMSLVPRLARREIGVANTVAVSALKEKLFRKYLDELLFDSSLLQILYVRYFNLAIRYPIFAAYLIRNFFTSQQSDEENCLVLFVKKWAKQSPEYGFLLEEVLDIVGQIRDEDFLMD